jgi:hypothetical protein
MKSDSPNTTIINQLKIVKVSKKLNYEEFSHQQDFGMFSTVFDFNHKTSKKNNKEIYIEDSESQNTKTFIIKATAGQFSKIGFAFNFKRYIKKLEIMAKVTVKKMLFIKK